MSTRMGLHIVDYCALLKRLRKFVLGEKSRQKFTPNMAAPALSRPPLPQVTAMNFEQNTATMKKMLRTLKSKNKQSDC